MNSIHPIYILKPFAYFKDGHNYVDYAFIDETNKASNFNNVIRELEQLIINIDNTNLSSIPLVPNETSMNVFRFFDAFQICFGPVGFDKLVRILVSPHIEYIYFKTGVVQNGERTDPCIDTGIIAVLGQYNCISIPF